MPAAPATESRIWRVLVPLAFLALTAYWTWPFPIHPGSTIPAMIGGDVSISISKFQTLALEGVNPFERTLMRTVQWPDGVGTTPGIEFVSILSALWLFGTAHTIGAVAGHGLLAAGGHLLTALVTYGFVSAVTGSRRAGLVAGAAYGFASHMSIVVWAASTYGHMWLFILPMWGFWRLAQEPGAKRALLAGASAAPAIFWTPYFALHVTVVGAACLLVFLAVGDAPAARRLKLAGLSIAPWLATVAVYVAIGLATKFSDVPARQTQDFFEQSAHPYMYLVPGWFSSLWGQGPAEWTAARVPRAAGVNLYLGWSVLLLGLVAVAAVLVPALRRRTWSGPAIAGLMGLSVAAWCFIFSLPPKVLDSRVPLPSSLIFEVEPALRAGQRFVMPLMAGTAVLAGIGAWVLLRRFGARPLAGAAIALGLTAVVLADIKIEPAGAWSRTSPPSRALAELEERPPAPAIHYMVNGLLDSPSMRACFVQPEHGKVIANGCAIGGRSPRLTAWQDTPVCEALVDQRKIGIRYVIVDNSRPDVIACFDDAELPRSELVARDEQVTVIEWR